MLLLTVVLLFASGVLSDSTEDEYCNQRRPAHCFTDEEENPVGFPDSEEKLNKMCPIILPRLKCGIDYLKECQTKRIQRNSFESKLEDLQDFIVEACDKETKLHRELSSSLPCIKNVIVSHGKVCMPMIQEAREEIANYISIDVSEGNLVLEDDLGKYYCFLEALQFSCALARTSVTCGDDASNVVQDVFDRFMMLDEACEGHMNAEIKAAVAIVQIEMEKKLASDETISED